jgi:hypothetical protein
MLQQAGYILDNWDDFVASLKSEKTQETNHVLRSVIRKIVITDNDLSLEFV